MNEQITSLGISGRRFFKQQARKILYNDWICQILAFLIVGAIVAGVNTFGTSVYCVIAMLTPYLQTSELFVWVYTTLSFVVLLPLFMGLVYFEKETLENGKGRITDIFHYFSDFDEITRAYSISLSTLFYVFLCFFPCIVLGLLKFYFYYEGIFGFTITYGNIDLVGTALRTLIVLLLYLGIVLSSRYIVLLFISTVRCELSFSELKMLSKVCIFGERVKITNIALSFFPLFVLSLFTMGFLFIVYSMPYMFITFVSFSKYLYEKEMFLKNTGRVLYTTTKQEN